MILVVEEIKWANKKAISKEFSLVTKLIQIFFGNKKHKYALWFRNAVCTRCFCSITSPRPIRNIGMENYLSFRLNNSKLESFTWEIGRKINKMAKHNCIYTKQKFNQNRLKQLDFNPFYISIVISLDIMISRCSTEILAHFK